MPKVTPEAEQPKNPNEEVVELDTPIVRGEQKIDKLVLRKPVSGELRGVKLDDLIHMDVLSLRTVLPRITTPTLTDIEVGRMDPADLLACGVAVTGFLLQKRHKVDASLTA